MLKADPIELMKEIADSKAALKSYLRKRAEIIRAMAGSHYRDGKGTKNPENFVFAYKEFVAPQLVYGEPTPKVKPTAPQFADIAEAHELALTAWGKETNMKDTVNAILDDAMVGFGYSKHGIEQVGRNSGPGMAAVRGNYEAEALYPFAVRVNPENAIIDSQATSWDEVRIMGETYEQDLDDVQNDWRNDPEAVARLAEVPRENDRTKDTQAFEPAARTAERKRVVLHEVYLRDHQLLITLGETGQDSAVILRQEPYFGPDEGPFVMWGIESIPGELLPCPPLMAMWSEHEEVMTHTRQTIKSARTHKRIGVYGVGKEADAKRVQNAQSGEFIGVQDTASIKDFELGGASDTQINYTQYVRDRFQTNLGFGEAQQGVAAKGNTATGEQIAGQNSDLRVDRMRDRLAGSISRVYRGVCWYFQYSSDIRPINTQSKDPITGAMMPTKIIPGRWEGGYVDNMFIDPEVESNIDSDYAVTIDPDSLTKSDDALEQKRAQDELALGFQLIPIVEMYGYRVNLKGLIDRYGQKLGTPNLSDIILQEIQPGLGMPNQWATGQGQQMLGANPGLKPTVGKTASPRGSMPSFGSMAAGIQGSKS